MDIYMYIYNTCCNHPQAKCLILYIWVSNKNNNNWPLHCVSWINFNLQMATVYLVFLMSVTICRKYFLCDSLICPKNNYMDLKEFKASGNFAPLHNGLIITVSVYNNIIKFFNT